MRGRESGSGRIVATGVNYSSAAIAMCKTRKYGTGTLTSAKDRKLRTGLMRLISARVKKRGDLPCDFPLARQAKSVGRVLFALPSCPDIDLVLVCPLTWLMFVP